MSSRPEELDLTRFAAEVIEERARVLRSRLRKVKKSDEREAVHQARVAGRRLREALRLARVVAPDLSRKAARGAREVTRALGELRTRDSLALLLGAMTLPPGAQGARMSMRARLEKREKLLGRGRLAMCRGRILRLFPRARALTRRLRQRSSWDAPKGRAHLASLASAFIEPRVQALVRYLQSLPPAPGTEALHKGRILVKKLRYAWELLRPLLPREPFKELRRRLEEVQEVGGRYHDLELLGEEVSRRRKKARPKLQGSFEELELSLSQERQEHRDKFILVLLPLKEEGFQSSLFALLDPGASTFQPSPLLPDS